MGMKPGLRRIYLFRSSHFTFGVSVRRGTGCASVPISANPELGAKTGSEAVGQLVVKKRTMIAIATKYDSWSATAEVNHNLRADLKKPIVLPFPTFSYVLNCGLSGSVCGHSPTPVACIRTRAMSSLDLSPPFGCIVGPLLHWVRWRTDFSASIQN